MPRLQSPSGGFLMRMKTYVCNECEIYALGIEVEPQDALCICGRQMEVEE